MAKGTVRPRKHLDIEKRKMIEAGLNEGRCITEIAKAIDVSVSTVQREILRNCRWDGPSSSKGAERTDCAHLPSCKLKGVCGPAYLDGACKNRVCKRCAAVRCDGHCTSYERRVCKTVEGAPFVCNACARFGRCTLERWRYSAEGAQRSTEARSHEARSGIDMKASEMALLIKAVRAGLKQGQSIHHIFATNDLPCSERSFYRHVENEDIPILSIELAKKVKYKKRRHAKAASHASGFYAGHEYEDYLELPEEDRAVTTEVDTVLGKANGRQCILSLHRIDLHFQVYLLLPRKAKECVVKALDWLEECSDGRFSEFFGLLLLDRGSEFDDIAGIERSSLSTGTRCAAYFTDPSRPDQKAECEKNHVELRKVLPKGTSLDALDAWTLAEVCSHVNSTVRKGCGDVSPIQLAQLVLPQTLFDNLGLRLISPKDVIAAPGQLYSPGR